MSFTTLVILFSGFVLLIAGAEFLVRGASKIAAVLGVSPLIIGLTVVSFGTSSPEIAVSVQSSYIGKADIALGNVVGSNIANILLVLGFSALAAPLVVSRQLIRLDVPIMIGVSILLLLVGLDNNLSWIDGSIFVLILLVYSYFLMQQSKKNPAPKEDDEFEKEYGDSKNLTTVQKWVINPLLVVVGFVMLIYGSDLLVEGAVIVAKNFGISELVIGLTVIAIGTSLPELATSVIASFRGERDIAVGNAVGSNLYNILLVLGLSSIVSPDGLLVSDSAIRLDIPVMIGVALLCLPIFFNGKVSRWEGFFFLFIYLLYLLYLFFKTSSHPLLPLFYNVLIYGVVPFTVVLLIGLTWRAIKIMRQGNLSENS